MNLGRPIKTNQYGVESALCLASRYTKRILGDQRLERDSLEVGLISDHAAVITTVPRRNTSTCLIPIWTLTMTRSKYRYNPQLRENLDCLLDQSKLPIPRTVSILIPWFGLICSWIELMGRTPLCNCNWLWWWWVKKDGIGRRKSKRIVLF